MKLGSLTKRDKRSETTSKKIEDDITLENCNIIVIFPSFGQFGAIRKLDSKGIAWKGYIVINSNL